MNWIIRCILGSAVGLFGVFLPMYTLSTATLFGGGALFILGAVIIIQGVPDAEGEK